MKDLYTFNTHFKIICTVKIPNNCNKLMLLIDTFK